ncbi:hypothetical protein BaRGS_00040315 [Batillaria attramentaria]|uniref:SWIM-type domain-containing protein n=1 Tax=Batillaria attramentaria TaxID=370345 RepID=A0ABD0J0K0_9CAEN
MTVHKGRVKSLGAHNQVTSGWVKDVLSWSNRNPSHQGATPANTCVTGKVYHSQRLSDPPEQPWVIISHDGEILTAHCRCQAGLGETCSHVAALLFTVEATVRIRDSTTVTQKPAYWNMPNSKEVAYLPAHKIDFTSAATKKKLLDSSINGERQTKAKASSRTRPDETSDGEFQTFCEKIAFSSSGVKPVMLSLVAMRVITRVHQAPTVGGRLS